MCKLFYGMLNMAISAMKGDGGLAASSLHMAVETFTHSLDVGMAKEDNQMSQVFTQESEENFHLEDALLDQENADPNTTSVLQNVMQNNNREARKRLKPSAAIHEAPFPVGFSAKKVTRGIFS